MPPEYLSYASPPCNPTDAYDLSICLDNTPQAFTNTLPAVGFATVEFFNGSSKILMFGSARLSTSDPTLSSSADPSFLWQNTPLTVTINGTLPKELLQANSSSGSNTFQLESYVWSSITGLLHLSGTMALSDTADLAGTFSGTLANYTNAQISRTAAGTFTVNVTAQTYNATIFIHDPVCYACQQCMAAAEQFVSTSWNSNATATQSSRDFTALCSSSPVLNSTNVCAKVGDTIISNSRLGRRAAALCSALQLCPVATISNSCAIDISPVAVVGGKSQSVPAAQLDMCSVEGLSYDMGGSYVPGEAPTITRGSNQGHLWERW